MMALRDLRLDDDQREKKTEDAVFSLLDSIVLVDRFLQYEVIAHSDALEYARNHLSEILEKAKR